MPPSRRTRRSPESQRRINHGTAIVVPIFVVGFAVYVTYVDVDIVCNQYLLNPQVYYQGLDLPRRTGAAIAILVLHFLSLILFLLCYTRVLQTIASNPGYIGPKPLRPVKKEVQQTTFVQSCAATTVEDDGVDPAQSAVFDRTAILSGRTNLPPGASAFYEKEAFICDYQGLPNYCIECGVYKPDRSHHSSDVGRCTRRMDHFCPWVGGMVCERNHKFFYQFLVYACCFSILVLVIMAYFYTDLKHRTGDSNGHLIASIVIAALFTLFTVGMVFNTGHLISQGLTTVEGLDRGRRMYHIAVLIPASANFTGLTITYPLGAPPGPRTGTRTFAVLQTQQGDRPWDLGVFQNWQDLMGYNIFDWLLPVRPSPFCTRDRIHTEYEFGPVVERLKASLGLVESTNKK